MKHVLDVTQFDRRSLDQLISHADHLRALPRSSQRLRQAGTILATIFYEPSTRTRLSFESAISRLGGAVISTENANESSSATKGETIEDTARILAGYADLIVMRHPVAGTPSRAAAVSNVPVINAGDGAREHPTQALLDLYTLHRELGSIDGLHIALMGDLKYGRAPRSLARLLCCSEHTRITFIAPRGVEMEDDVKRDLDKAGVVWREESDLARIAPELDALYQTRIQKERFPTTEAYTAARGHYIVDTRTMQLMAEHSIVLHPLPRVDEIDSAIDDDPRSAYFRQAENGVFLRMALIDLLLNAEL